MMKNNVEKFDTIFKYILIVSVLFILSILLLNKFNLFEQINKSPLFILLFLSVLLFPFGYIFSKSFNLHKSFNDLVEKDISHIVLSIIIHPTSHPLLKKYLYFVFFPFITQITYSFGSSSLMIEDKVFASRRRSVIKWEDIIPALTSIEYKKEYSVIVLFRKVLSTRQEQFNPIVYLYFKPFPDNIMILVNNDKEAEKVVDLIRNLLIKFNRNINIHI